MRVVIDTGVLVAGVFWAAEPHRVVRAWLRGLLIPVVSDAIFDEYARVLARTRHREGFTTDMVPWLDALRHHAQWVEPVTLNQPVCRDASDDKFIEGALAGAARPGFDDFAETLRHRDHDAARLAGDFEPGATPPAGLVAQL